MKSLSLLLALILCSIKDISALRGASLRQNVESMHGVATNKDHTSSHNKLMTLHRHVNSAETAVKAGFADVTKV